MSELQARYDAVLYDDVVAPLTDPSMLGALGRLFGLRTSDPAQCRVLELGCGQGLNLMAMAAQYPQAQFVGVDFAAAGLEQGRALARQAGLHNVELIHADLMRFEWPGPRFDYIVTWGVFSWVPDEIKERVLALSRALLAPQGLACICFLTYPGAKLHEGLRDLMRLRAQGQSSAEAVVAAGRSVLQAVSRGGAALGKRQAAPQAWAQVAAQLLQKPSHQLFHDELGDCYDPCYLLQFVDWAREHGLVYVTDADTPGSLVDTLPPDAVRELHALSDDALEREQVSDCLTHRTLRVALLARDDDERDIAFSPDAMNSLCLSTPMREAPATVADGESGTARFIGPQGGELAVHDPVTARVLQALCRHNGGAVPMSQLIGQEPPVGVADMRAGDLPHWGARLFSLVARQALRVSLTACYPVNPVPEQLRLTALNRVLVARRSLVVTSRQQALKLSPQECAVLQAMDSGLPRLTLIHRASTFALDRPFVERMLQVMLADGVIEVAPEAS